MPKLETRADLQRLIADEIQESLTLEYKASPALAKDSKARDELCKDVSAFANSAGGQIVYGITEADHKPVSIDGGSDLSREWIEQVIDSNVQPRIEGLVISSIELNPGRYAYVITIPQALGRAAHQAPDHKYYKRQNFQSVPMEDYEVKDVMHRASTPVLDVDLAFLNTGSPTQARLLVRGERCDPIYLQFTVRNLSSKPAEYAILIAYVDSAFSIGHASNFQQRIDSVLRFETACQAISANLGLPTSPPLFREYPEIAGLFSIALLANKVGTLRLVLGCDICTPGFIRRKLWIARALGEFLLLEPGEDQPIE
jgi:hypothetical protein